MIIKHVSLCSRMNSFEIPKRRIETLETFSCVQFDFEPPYLCVWLYILLYWNVLSTTICCFIFYFLFGRSNFRAAKTATAFKTVLTSAVSKLFTCIVSLVCRYCFFSVGRFSFFVVYIGEFVTVCVAVCVCVQQISRRAHRNFEIKF